MYKVLIADFALYDAVAEIPYILHKANCIVDVYCSQKSWLLKNSYWNKWIRADLSDTSLYANTLIELVKNESYDWIILCDDQVIRFMNDTISDPILFRKILPLSKIEHRYLLGSKAGLSNLCTEYGITTPFYIVCKDVSELFSASKHISFPFLIKIDKSEGGSGIFLCEDEASLKKTADTLSSYDTRNMVLQSYIRGSNVGVEAFYKNGVLLAYACATVTQTLGNEFNISVARQYYARPDIESNVVFAGEALGLQGFVNMTYIYEPLENTYYLIEADTRPNSWFALCSFAGVDFSEAVRNYISGTTTLIRPNNNKEHPILIRNVRRSIIDALRKGNISEFWKWCVNTDNRWKFIPWYDKKLIRALLWNIMTLSVLYVPRTVIQKIKGYV